MDERYKNARQWPKSTKPMPPVKLIGKIEMKIAAQLRNIGATDGEVRFLLGCDLPADADEINEWCSINLDDLRRSQ